MIRLWTINRVLRWTGWRITVVVDHYTRAEYPTMVGLEWCGIPGSNRWRKAEGERTRASGGKFISKSASHELPQDIEPVAEVAS